MKKWIALLLALSFGLLALPAGAAEAAAKTIYAVNSSAYTYHRVPAADHGKIEKALSLPAGKAKLDEKAKNLGGFCVFDGKDGKTLYIVTETQVVKDGAPLSASAAQRKSLLTLCQGYWSQPGIPELLGYMSPEKVTEGSFDGIDTGFRTFLPLTLRAADAPDALNDFVRIFKTLSVEPGEASSWNPVNTTAEVMGGEIQFDTGVVYEMYLWDDSMTIRVRDPSAKSRAYRYRFAATGMEHPRGWYLRAEMGALYARYDGVEEAILIDIATRRCVRITGEYAPQQEALCRLSVFAQRFCQPPPTGGKAPPWGPEKNPQADWTGIYCRLKGGDKYREIWLRRGEQGGRYMGDDEGWYYNKSLPGDCAYIVSLMDAGEAISPDEVRQKLTNHI